MKSYKNNTLFWVLQIIGWIIPASNSWGKFLFGSSLKPSYIILEGLAVMVSGIIASSLLRKHLKSQIDFAKLDKFAFKKISLSYIVASMTYFVLTLMLASFLYYFIQNQPLPLNTIMLISNALNSLTFMLIWLVIYISIKAIIRLRQAKFEQLLLQSELKEAQLNTLKGQINPHFMFNSLNNIRGLILEDKHKAREMLTRLSEMLRYSLNKNKVDTIEISDELEMVGNFIALSKIQLEKRLSFEKNIDEKLLTIKIPPMIIQMLIENAIKHGIANQADGGLVQLSILKKGKHLIIQVNNTGKLSNQSDSTKLGLENIQKRLNLLYKNQASFSLNEIYQQVVATIQIPYEG